LIFLDIQNMGIQPGHSPCRVEVCACTRVISRAMHRNEFNYDLPPELIARYPSKRRGDSRLLRLHRSSGELNDHDFPDLVSMLNPGDLLVFNDTRVIPARLYGTKETGGRTEILLERLLAGVLQQLQQYRCLFYLACFTGVLINTFGEFLCLDGFCLFRI